jgi:ABC-2 type transport system permease protein
MNKLGALVRAGLKANFGLSVFCHRIFREKKDRWLLPTLGFSLLGLFPMLYGLIAFIKEAYAILHPIRQEAALLAMGVVIGQMLILIFGIYYVISAFYFSRDIEMLVPLPLRPSEVLLSKFIVIAINEYLTIAAIVLPFIITFGILAHAGLGFWLMSCLVYLALPLIPLAIIATIVVIMMRFVNVSRKKDLFILVGGVAVLAAVIGFQIMAQHAGSAEMSRQDLTVFLTSPDSLLNKIGSAFPPSIWAAKALSGGFSGKGLLNMAAFLGTSLLSFGAIIVLGEQFFYRGVIGLTETGARKRVLTKDEMSQRVSSGRRAISAIFMREVRIMNRTPVFLLNGVLVVVILPAFFIFLFRPGLDSPSKDLQNLFEAGHSMLFILFAALFMIVCGSLNGTAASTFSREGAQFWISRMIPVAPREQIAAKFLHSYAIGLMGVIAAALVLKFMLPIKFIHLAIAVGLALVATALMTVAGMFIDLARPLLDWTNPQKAIKQNLNVLLAMLADAAIIAAAFFGIKTLIDANVSEGLILTMLFLSLICAATFGYLALQRFADKRYQDIDS